jgi:hypothetical protein
VELGLRPEIVPLDGGELALDASVFGRLVGPLDAA